MSALYEDRWITCTEDEIQIRGYYFPWGTKHVKYGEIREIRRVPMTSALSGRGRIWGSTTLRYWASLDPGRRRKDTALILDTGHRPLPFVTPDDPAKAVAVITANSRVPVVDADPVIA
jgi:hypothetical protein